MPRTARRALVAAGVAALVGAPAAQAGRPGSWTRLSDPPNVSNVDRNWLARTPDGVLHVAWKRTNPADRARDDLFHTAIRPNGATVLTSPIAQSWGSINDAAILFDPSIGGLRTLIGGQETVTTGAPHEWLSTAVAGPDGAAWTLSPTDVATGNSAEAGPSGATALADGTILTTWSSAVFVHRGLTALPSPDATPRFHTSDMGCCGYSSNLAAAADGSVWVAWYSNGKRPGTDVDDYGIFYQAVDPATGAPLPGSSRLKAPRSGVARSSGEIAIGPEGSHPTPLAALQGGQTGVLTAYREGYPTTERVRVFDIVSGRLRAIPSTRGASRIALAPDPSGRAWLLYETRDDAVMVRRSNVGATAWGAPVRVRWPRGTYTLWSVAGDAQGGRLDVVAMLQVGRGPSSPDTGIGAWHTQARPGLTLVIVHGSVRSSTGGRFRFRVLDAGDGLAGARIRVGNRTITTNAEGRASLLVSPGAPRGVRAVTVTKAGYTQTRGAVVVRR
jgi:hypothetical protein